MAGERALMAPLRAAADSVIETTDLTPPELREELRRRYGDHSDQPVLTIVSFGYARGVSRTADLMFDMRFLDNPHWAQDLRPLTGMDQPVRDHPPADAAWDDAMARLEALLTD